MINPVVVIAAEIIMGDSQRDLLTETNYLRLGTINIGGIISNVKYIEDCLNCVDILAVQEH